METVQYLCEFFFCDGFASLGRLITIAILFWCLSPKHNQTYYNIINPTDEDNVSE